MHIEMFSEDLVKLCNWSFDFSNEWTNRYELEKISNANGFGKIIFSSSLNIQNVEIFMCFHWFSLVQSDIMHPNSNLTFCKLLWFAIIQCKKQNKGKI